MALSVTRAAGWVPLGIIAAAVQDEREREAGMDYSMPPSSPLMLWGNRLLRGLSQDGAWLAGVKGMILAPVEQLPAEVQVAIQSDTLTPADGPVDLAAAGLTGWACVEETEGSWLLTVELLTPATGGRRE
ncbi:hypothetical protein ACFSC4_29870 [Deinococcus malanensis]